MQEGAARARRAEGLGRTTKQLGCGRNDGVVDLDLAFLSLSVSVSLISLSFVHPGKRVVLFPGVPACLACLALAHAYAHASQGAPALGQRLRDASQQEN